MGDTKIEYCTKVWNPVTGCTHSGSPGCDHCWAAAMVKRFPHLHGTKPFPYGDNLVEAIPFSTIQFHPSRLDEPLRWRKPQRVFVCSMGDLFHPEVSVTWLESVLAVITRCPQHTFMILSKRPERFLLLTEDRLRISRTDTWPIRNLWLGVSVENQQTADQRIPILLQTPAAKRFVSVEPCISHVDLLKYLNGGNQHEQGREGIYGPDRARGFQCGPGGEYLEARGNDRREPFGQPILFPPVYEPTESRKKHKNRIPNSDVFRGPSADGGGGPPCRLDGGESFCHSKGD